MSTCEEASRVSCRTSFMHNTRLSLDHSRTDGPKMRSDGWTDGNFDRLHGETDGVAHAHAIAYRDTLSLSHTHADTHTDVNAIIHVRMHMLARGRHITDTCTHMHRNIEICIHTRMHIDIHRDIQSHIEIGIHTRIHIATHSAADKPLQTLDDIW